MLEPTPRTPPRYVPTLTQKVEKPPMGGGATLAPSAHAAPEVSKSVAPELVAQQLRLQLLTQARQYIDIELQKRLREAVAQVALEHAHKMFEELQPHLEVTVHQVIDEAIKRAVAHAATHAPRIS